MRAGYDYIGVGTGALVFDTEGRVLMAQRGPHAKNERGMWEFPGGTVEFGESLQDAIQRELREEYAIEIRIGRMLSVFDHRIPEEQQHWISVVFLARYTAGVARIMEPEKCVQIGWFPLTALPLPRSKLADENLRVYVATTQAE